MRESEVTQRLHGLQPTRLLHSWDFPGKGTGVGCHCLLRQYVLLSYNSLCLWVCLSLAFPLTYSVLFYFFSWVENPMAQDWVCWTQMIERFCCLEFCTYIWLFQFEGAGVIQSSIIQVSPHPCLGDDLIPLKKNDSTSVLLYHIKFEKSRRFDGWLNDMSSVETLLFVGGWRSKIDGTVLICVYLAVYRNSYSCRW